MRITKVDTDGTITDPNILGEMAIDNYVDGGDAGRMYYNDGTSDIAVAKKIEVDAIEDRVIVLEEVDAISMAIALG